MYRSDLKFKMFSYALKPFVRNSCKASKRAIGSLNVAKNSAAAAERQEEVFSDRFMYEKLDFSHKGKLIDFIQHNFFQQEKLCGMLVDFDRKNKYLSTLKYIDYNVSVSIDNVFYYYTLVVLKVT